VRKRICLQEDAGKVRVEAFWAHSRGFVAGQSHE
jgi:hypothetical protein